MRPLDPAALTSRPEFDVHLAENVPVPMRDGVRLATDVYRPARDGRPVSDRRPVLLHRTPYNKTETEATLGQCRWFAARGYVVVNQDCRGCFRSEGEVNTLYPTSNLFVPGHRIRLDISSSNHPRFDVNPNTGEPIGRERRRGVADNTVFHERGRASRIVLPIIPLEPSRP